jgi:hypothetical protein
MTDWTRAGIPQNFQDLTSDIMLRAPEPQYFHASLIKGIIAAQVLKTGIEQFGLPMPGRDAQWAGVGADVPSSAFAGLVLNDSSGIFEAGMYFDDFDRMDNPRPGHSVRVNRPVFTDSTYTLASRTIASGSTISTTGQTVGMGQVDLILRRIGGPYNNTAAAVTPYVLDRFDMGRGIHATASLVGMYMQRDCDKTLDKIGVDLLDAVDTSTGIVRPGNMTADNDSGAAGSFKFSYSLLAKIKTAMVTAHVLPFRNGRYALVLHPRQVEQLKLDMQYQRLSAMQQAFNPLFTGSYQFTVDGFDIYQSTTLSTATNGSSITIYYGQAFGRSVLGLGCPRKPEVVRSTADNYGESIPLIWLSYFAATVLDNRYTLRVTTD